MIHRRKFIKNTTLITGGLAGSSLTALLASEVDNPPVSLFIHGVASGDPETGNIIIWTRINATDKEIHTVKWIISTDPLIGSIIQSGEVSTNEEIDYTIKVGVTGLKPATVYYYQFISGEHKSPIGKTKTTAANGTSDCNFAVVSCNNFSAGYFNAFAKIAEKKELDAVIHLGDYIYEGTKRTFDTTRLPDDDFEATHFYRNRNWWLHYYRSRYAINRLDPDLQAAHHAHPFITIWDDHEIADNTWKGGARDHNTERDGEWEIRKSAAKQAYAEWMPIRGNASSIYRSVQFGQLAELILLDTRLEGRDQQLYNADKNALYKPGRTLLGAEQKEWFFNRITNSPCTWKLVANQVIFSPIDVEWAAAGGRFADKLQLLENTLADYWQGYAAERDEIINHVQKKQLNNLVILSASFHCALAFDVTKRPTQYTRKGENATYDPATSKGSVAVEFAAPSINSENFDEKMGGFYAGLFQAMINKKLPQPLNYNPNPHMKYADLQRHGYIILKLSKTQASANFYFVDDILKKTAGEKLDAVWYTKAGQNHLQKA